jgi:hypothetical protein
MKRIFKYATGDEIPKGAIYLSTQVEEKPLLMMTIGEPGEKDTGMKYRLVWHYFLVEVNK